MDEMVEMAELLQPPKASTAMGMLLLLLIQNKKRMETSSTEVRILAAVAKCRTGKE